MPLLTHPEFCFTDVPHAWMRRLAAYQARSFTDKKPIAVAYGCTACRWWKVVREAISSPISESTPPGPGFIEVLIETDVEEDGRWVADVVDLPGVMCYGATHDEAIQNAKALAKRVLHEQVENDEMISGDAK